MDSGLVYEDFNETVPEPAPHDREEPRNLRPLWIALTILAIIVLLGAVCVATIWPIIQDLRALSVQPMEVAVQEAKEEAAKENGGTGNDGLDNNGDVLPGLVEKSGGKMSFSWEEATWIGDGQLNALIVATNGLGESIAVVVESGPAVNFKSGMISGNFILADAEIEEFKVAAKETGAKYYLFVPSNAPAGKVKDAPGGFDIWVNKGVYEEHEDKAEWNENVTNHSLDDEQTFGSSEYDFSYFQGWDGGSRIVRIIVVGGPVDVTAPYSIEGS